MAQYLGWTPVLFVSGDDSETGESSSKWVLLTANTEWLERSGLARRGAPWTARAHSLDRRFRQPVARAEFLSGTLGEQAVQKAHLR